MLFVPLAAGVVYAWVTVSTVGDGREAWAVGLVSAAVWLAWSKWADDEGRHYGVD